MDDLDEPQASEFVTDNEDQDSLDERIDYEQRTRNQQLWSSFQKAACCVTELYRDCSQPWVPFQNAASNLTTLYKDCIESQRSFARIGYQVGRRRRMKDLNKLFKKHKIPAKYYGDLASIIASGQDSTNHDELVANQHNNVSSILAVNKLNIGCGESSTSGSKQAQPTDQYSIDQHSPQTGPQAVNHHANTSINNQQHQSQHQIDQNSPNLQILIGNNEDHLVTFQQALAQQSMAVRGIKSSQGRRSSSNSSHFMHNRSLDPKTEEERLTELNQFLSEEYQRHVGSRKRTYSTLGGSPIKRFRD